MIKSEFSSVMRTLLARMCVEDVEESVAMIMQGTLCVIRISPEAGGELRVEMLRESDKAYVDSWYIEDHAGTFEVLVSPPTIRRTMMLVADRNDMERVRDQHLHPEIGDEIHLRRRG